MMPPTQFTLDDYLKAFRARRACCRALVELSREQQRLIDVDNVDNYDELITILEMKQRLVDELTDAAGAAWHAWKQNRAELPTAGQQVGDALLAETESLLLTLLDEEQLGVARLMARRATTERELTQLSSVEQIDAAYRPAAITGSRWGLDVNL